MLTAEQGLLLAGFVLAHAAWNVSDLPKGELLVPLAVVERSGQRELVRFEADTQEEAISRGKAAMVTLGTTVDGWAFARDGLFREASGTVDALSVDFWAKGMDAPATVVQRYEPYANAGRFRLIGDPVLVLGGKAQTPDQAKPLLAALLRGVEQHPKARALWADWKGSRPVGHPP
jgi:hypothetical protein